MKNITLILPVKTELLEHKSKLMGLSCNKIS